MEDRPMTYDESSMERSKSFIQALQDLKNLKPQLYSAAEYCDKSYLHSEQKQMVLDNLKDYTVRALANAVDHFGTVAYNLTDLLEEQSLDITVMELQVTSLDQEGLRQQQLLATIPRHHKHYILPNFINKKVHFSPQVHADVRQNHFPAKARSQTSGTPAAKTLSWHLASETKSTLKASQQSEERKPVVFNLLDICESTQRNPSAALIPVGSGLPTYATATYPSMLSAGRFDCAAAPCSYTVVHRDISSDGFDSYQSCICMKLVIIHASPRRKSMLSAFFVKTKAQRLKASAVS